MKNNRIRLTESQLHRVIRESVQCILNEDSSSTWKELSDAKKRGASANELLVILKKLESELEEEGCLKYRGSVTPNGSWKSTRDLSRLAPSKFNLD